jgi:hypothetical protein
MAEFALMFVAMIVILAGGGASAWMVVRAVRKERALERWRSSEAYLERVRDATSAEELDRLYKGEGGR